MVRRAKNVLFSSGSSLTRDDGSTSPKDVYNRSQLFMCQIKKIISFLRDSFMLRKKETYPEAEYLKTWLDSDLQ